MNHYCEVFGVDDGIRTHNNRNHNGTIGLGYFINQCLAMLAISKINTGQP